MSVSVVGEALIDLVPGPGPSEFVARLGGSPYNVAVGLARLGAQLTLFARMGDNAFGRLLRTHAADEGIDLSHAPHAHEPTTLAVVSLNANAQASYDFYLEGTADWQWTMAELAALPTAAAVTHFGSLASWVAPGAAVILDAMRQARAGGVLVSYDPNVRPSLLSSPAAARELIESSVAVAHVIKASRDDIEWLYPDLDTAAVAARWIALGVSLAVITDGADGAQAATASGLRLARPGRPITLVDTVGAGDAFTSGLLASLIRRGAATPSAITDLTPELLTVVVDDAIGVSALTCERAGAYSPGLDRFAFAD